MNQQHLENELLQLGIKVWKFPGSEYLGYSVKQCHGGYTASAHSLCVIDGENRSFPARLVKQNPFKEVIEYMYILRVVGKRGKARCVRVWGDNCFPINPSKVDVKK